MQKFSVVQAFDAPLDNVVAAFRSEGTWTAFEGLPFVGDPKLQSFLDADIVELAMSYKVSIDLPALADSFIDADKLTFVERMHLHADGTGTFEIVPDHYKQLLTSSGTTSVTSVDAERSERRIDGLVDVSLGWTGKLFERPVEDAIVNGLTQALTAQASQTLL